MITQGGGGGFTAANLLYIFVDSGGMHSIQGSLYDVSVQMKGLAIMSK